jgi:tight adherence protein C
MFAINLFNFETMVPLAVFGAFAALAWWILERMAAGNPRAVERLAELKSPHGRRNAQADSALKKSDPVTKMLEKATPALAKPLQPKTEMELSKLKAKLSYAGFRGETAGSIFLGLKFAGLMTGLFLGGGTLLSLKGMTQNSLVFSMGLAGFLFYLPDIVVGFIGKNRKQAVFHALPDALD